LVSKFYTYNDITLLSNIKYEKQLIDIVKRNKRITDMLEKNKKYNDIEIRYNYIKNDLHKLFILIK